MRILDRYILQKFIVPFLYCFFGFIAIWLVFDLSDNGPDFISAHAPLSTVWEFYMSQIPEIIVISLPVGTLLALLYSLTQMSRVNEVVAMLTSGVSLVRVVLPLFGVGLVLTGVSAYFNYEKAPQAAAIKKQMLRDVKKGKKTESGVKGHLYRNREDYRTWFMQRLRPETNRLNEVQVVQQDAEGTIQWIWYSRNVYYEPETSSWRFEYVKMVDLDADGNITKQHTERLLRISDWRETPMRIYSSVMNPDYLGIPQLKEYLEINKDFPQNRLAPYRTQLAYRYALPWVNLLVIFLAAPLGIVYSRRGILGGVAGAIGLFFSLVFLSSLFLAFGKGGHMPPGVAVWTPMGGFFLISLYLLWLKATNRELPHLKLPWT